MLNLKFICKIVGRCAYLELKKEMGLENEHSPNIHEILAILPAWIIVFMELTVCVYSSGWLGEATLHKITMDYDVCCDL